jgi:hypothetical protein
MGEKRLRSREIASKMLKTRALVQHPSLRPYIPETRWYDPNALLEMLRKYGSVFIKPDKGGGGGGAIRLVLGKDGRVECRSLHSGSVRRMVETAQWVKRSLKPGKRYIMQRGVRLAKVDGRPFDIRIHLQKAGDWKVLGMCAKVAAPGKIVTNYCKGSQPMEVAKALAAACGNSERRAKLYAELHALSILIAKTLNTRFKGIQQLGIDAGIDENFRIWIFEVNTRPRFKMFRALKDRSTYRRIKAMHRLLV